MFLSWAATIERKGVGSRADSRRREKGKGIMIADASRAFLQVSARRNVCVELPEEALGDGESVVDTVGKLKASLYGTRDA